MRGITRTTRSPRLDTAVAETLTKPVTADMRIELEKMQAAFDEHGLGPDPLDPPSLSNAMLSFIMPHLSNTSILRHERRRWLLAAFMRRLEVDFPDDAFAHGGVLALRHELRSLDLLRGNRDSLIEG